MNRSAAAPSTSAVVAVVALFGMIVTALAAWDVGGGTDAWPLRNRWDGRCLTVEAGGQAVSGSDCEDTPAQRWWLVPVERAPGDHHITLIEHIGSGTCLAAALSSPGGAESHTVVIGPCDSSQALQRWRVETAEGIERIRLTNVGVDVLGAPAVLDVDPNVDGDRSRPRFESPADLLSQWWTRAAATS
jgi:hypothetical protein